jgi:hypothetical protein
MIRFLFTVTALLAVLVPASADAGQPRKRYVPYYNVTAVGTVDESWRIVPGAPDYCGRQREGSGRTVVRFASPRPKRVSFNIDYGFASKLPVDVTVEREGSVRALQDVGDCPDYDVPHLSDGTACGARSYKTKVDLNYPSWFHPRLLRTEQGLFGRDCPSVGTVGDAFHGEGGTTANRLRRLLYLCGQRAPCKHKRTNVLRFDERKTTPVIDLQTEQPIGERVTHVSWEVKFVWLNPYPGALSGRAPR